MAQELERIFPGFLEIRDEELRRRAEEAMELAMAAGGWCYDTLPLCPVTLNWRGCDISWIEHVTDVTQLCLMEFDALEKYYRRHGVPFRRDLVAAGALLHDIGKLTEFVLRDGRPVHSDHADLLRHPLSGALLAARAGLPDELIHLIAVHSFEGERSYQTAESAFVRSIDMFVFHSSVTGLEKA